ncbi:uncharacterized protein ARMOST_16100 [Armillaria ostoyae]|uniref:Uncharacterized protein n=1 Tax=Armillaria ostoyae TaxID=47428 RepID=A0A284RV80_ARMOS|nr:uncharacterized protein ARMOST_16100 [Armillaria ostoyae]
MLLYLCELGRPVPPSVSLSFEDCTPDTETLMAWLKQPNLGEFSLNLSIMIPNPGFFGGHEPGPYEYFCGVRSSTVQVLNCFQHSAL